MENLNYKLTGIIKDKDSMQDFEGPLSLILLLLRKNRIEIRDLRVSDILDQYLEYLARMEEMDLELASEFVQMASHLLYLKTKELLTSEEEADELEQLMQSLELLQAKDRFAAMTSVIPQLKAASETGLRFFCKQPEPVQSQGQEYAYHHKPLDLLKAMLALWTRDGTGAPAVEESFLAAVPHRMLYSIRNKGREILDCLRGGPKTAAELYRQCVSGSELVATFVAILELCSSGSLRIDRAEGQTVLSFHGSAEEIDRAIESIEEEA